MIIFEEWLDMFVIWFPRYAALKKYIRGPIPPTFPATFFSGITAQEMKFYIKDFFSKWDQIRSFLENFIFCVVYRTYLLMF